MKNIKRIWICQLIVTSIIFMVLISGCKKDNNISLPSLTTSGVSDISIISATCGGNISSDGGSAITAKGVCWSTEQSPTIADNITTDGTGTGSYTSAITGLSPNTLYNVRAYATNSAGTEYGNELSFTTEPSTLHNGLVAYYPFNGNVNDESGNGNNGFNYGVVSDYDRFGNLACAYFDGYSAYFEAPDDPSINFGTEKDFSFCLWIKPEYSSQWNSLISKGTEDSPIYQLALWDGCLLFESGSRQGSCLSTSSLPFDEWCFCVAVVERSADCVKFYINGQLTDTITDDSLAGYNFSSEATLKFGVERLFLSGFYFLGNMDEIRIYNRAVNIEEIEALYNE